MAEANNKGTAVLIAMWAWKDPTTGSITLTSGDRDLGEDGVSVYVKRGSKADAALRGAIDRILPGAPADAL